MLIENATIEKTFLGYEDHGIFTFMLSVNYGSGMHQGIGNISLDSYDKEQEKRVPTSLAGIFISEIIRTVGVDSWEKMKGKHIRVKLDREGLNAMPIAIGHIVDDRWFEFKEILDQLQNIREL